MLKRAVRRVSALSPLGAALAATLVAVVPASAQAPSRQLNVIVSSSSPIAELSDQEVRQIFTARRLRWQDLRIRVALNPGDADAYEQLARKLTGRSARALGLLWLEAGFKAAAPAPTVVGSDEEMISYVLATPEAIGYTTLTDLPDSVRVVNRMQLDGR